LESKQETAAYSKSKRPPGWEKEGEDLNSVSGKTRGGGSSWVHLRLLKIDKGDSVIKKRNPIWGERGEHKKGRKTAPGLFKEQALVEPYGGGEKKRGGRPGFGDV